MAKNLVIVESPAKAKTLKKFLGSSYKIEASVGHVRDLPKSELGIDIENDFEPRYITIRGKGVILAKLRKEVKNADKVYLATDPDREGEAISWHLLKALKLEEDKVSRITFNEITKTAVRKSIKEAKKIDMDLVDAQQARRELDRIVGYKISPLLWKKVKKGLSAGRVQSVALKIMCDREDEIENFDSEEYWSLDVILKHKKSDFLAKLHSDKEGKIELKNKDQVDEIIKYINKQKFTVNSVKTGKRVRKTVAPFTTSTMQQEASKLLGFATYKTMMIAQQLYEGVDIKGEGTVALVSYIRTDSTRISDEAFVDLSSYILETYGKEYTIEKKNEYKNKGKAQEAHEAIRPIAAKREPQSIKASLTKDQFKLYKLIWERFVASQMPPAVYDTLSIKINAGKYTFTSSGSLINFNGFLIVYKKNTENEEEGKMPKLEEGDIVTLNEIKDEQHFTKPSPRYTEAMLVKTMEELGIGRPSTYAATISNLITRRYVIKESKVFYSTELGEIVNDIMKNNFEEIVNIDFTAKMETDLDKVEEGKLHWKEVLRKFYPGFEEQILIAEEKIGQIEISDEVTDIICEECGKNMVIKYGKFGKFMACPGFPECRNTKTFFEEAGSDCPTCKAKVLIKKTKKGRRYFGCENNPECEFMSWSKPTGKLCPTCNEVLIEKGTKDKKIICSNKTCFYTEEFIEPEED
jgi:DNA topoisomerase I